MRQLQPINKKRALQFLMNVKECLKGRTWFLTMGTLLGAVREGNFIDWDFDIDLMMLRKYEPDMQGIANCLKSKGCSATVITCRDERKEITEMQIFIQINYQGVPGHIALRDHKSFKGKGHLVPGETRTIMGVEFPVPKNPEKLLEEIYGDWRTPTPPRHYRQSANLPEGAWHD